MKKLIIALATIMVTSVAYGQGTVQFNNRITGVVDARVLAPDGSGAGAGFTAQLLGGPQGGALAALTPTTTFRTTSAAAQGYVNAVDVTVPGVAAGQTATLQLRAYNGANFASSLVSGQSGTINVALGGGNLPPAALAGLSGFTMTAIPEPSTIALGVLGLAALMVRRRK
ncbi:MAG: PEP-CTERM sorting domain-containing protein [Verrucomicrobia bacterium]|nr:PEP-CTERM sorting domain-containing protein [Verrucomicrobiota bacterium]